MQAAAQGEDAWEEEEGCTMGGACGALGGELQVELELERRGSEKTVLTFSLYTNLLVTF